MHPPPLQNRDPLSRRCVEALFLHPDPASTDKSVCLPIGVEEGGRIFGGLPGVYGKIHPALDANGKYVFPDVSFHATTEDRKWAEGRLLRCTVCTHERCVRAVDYDNLLVRKGGMRCSSLVDTVCGEPDDAVERPPRRLKRGRIAGAVVGPVATHVSIHQQCFQRAFEEDGELRRAASICGFDECGVSFRVTAGVTRTCTKAERASAGAVAGRAKEVGRYLSHGVWDLGACYTFEQIREVDPSATTSHMVMLSSIKHAECDPQEWCHKGRLCVLGDRLVLVKNGQVKCFPACELWSPVASLGAARSCFAHSLVHGNELVSTDVESAYLQTRWDPAVPNHWVSVGPDVWEHFPPAVKAQFAASSRPLYLRLVKAAYGHPHAGRMFIADFSRTLVSLDWRPSDADPALYFHKGKSEDGCIAVYVDDVCASAGPEVSHELWTHLSRTFKFAEPAPCTKFLGMSLSRYVTSEGLRVLEICMTGYARLIASTFCSLWPDADVVPATTPIDRDLRSENSAEPVSREGLPARQKIVGMLLWFQRCCRPDIAFAVSSVACSIVAWTNLAYVTLVRTVGYIIRTEQCGLRLVFDPRDTIQDLRFRIQSDSDWSHPRSQTGFVAAIVSARPGSATHIPVGWGSSRQSVSADSSGSAEWIAMHTALRECLRLSTAVVPSANGPVEVEGDNGACMQVARTGWSNALCWLERVIGTKLAMMRDLVARGLARFTQIRGRDNGADLFTKALVAPELKRVREIVGVFPCGNVE